VGKEPDEIRREIEQTRDRMSDTVEAIGYKADVPTRTKEAVSRRKDNIVSSVRNAKDTVTSSIAGTGQRVGGTAGSMASSVSERTPSAQDVKQGARNAVGMAQENPLGLALGSIAVGFVAGLMVPSTRVEDERLGPIADQVKEKAIETGQEALDRGKQVVQETAQTAADAAQEAVQKTVSTAQEKSQEQGQELSSSAQEKAQEVRSDMPSSSSPSTRPLP
jgi:gas vesicle protein